MPARVLQIGEKVKIGGRSYLVIDALAAISRIPQQTVKTVAKLIRLCRGVKAYGFAASHPVDVGVVAWLPTNPLGCWTNPVTGGGPGSGGCLQGFRTPDGQTFVVFGGSSARICPALSTQVPGGWRAKTNTELQGIRKGTRFRIKCQTYDNQSHLLDYVATYAANLPASKKAFWIWDKYVDTGGLTRLPGIPSCQGINISFS